MKISIIIVSWNVRDYLKRCLESVFNTAKDVETEVFVVDNNSKDGTGEFVKKFFPQVNLIANKDNLGFAKANNQALRISKGEYILLLNPDTIVLPEALYKMANFLQTHKEYGAVGPKILTEDLRTTSQCSARNFPNIATLFLRLINSDAWLRVKSDSVSDTSNSHVTKAISGSCMMVRMDTINEVGVLDEEFFMYGEDVDWCYRINKNGWKIFYLSEATIVHYGEKSASIKYNEGENMAENFNAFFIYFKKNQGMLYAFCFRVMVGIIMSGWNVFWATMLIFSKKNKDGIMKTITRNKRLIKWSANIGGIKYIGTANN